MAIFVGVIATVALWKIIRPFLKAKPPEPVKEFVPPPVRINPYFVDRPRSYEWPDFTPVRGAYRCHSAQALNDYYASKRAADELLIRFAGVEHLAVDFLTKLILLCGKMGSGKTSLQKTLVLTLCRLMEKIPRLRLIIIDPTDSYLSLLLAAAPSDVPFFDMSPTSEKAWAWDCHRDILDSADAMNLANNIIAEALQNGKDPFWASKSRAVLEGICQVLLELGGRWELPDLFVPLVFREYLKPLLKLNRAMDSMRKQELVGRLGRDILATSMTSAKKFAIPMGMLQGRPADRRLGMEEFLQLPKGILYMRYNDKLIEPTSGYVNAVLQTLLSKTLARQTRNDFTYFVIDEGRYVADLTVLDHAILKGRGSGVGACISTVGTPSLVRAWSEARKKELVDTGSISCWLASGYESAHDFCNLVSKVEGYQYSHTTSWPNGGGRTGALTTKDTIIESEITGLRVPGEPGRLGQMRVSLTGQCSGHFKPIFSKNSDVSLTCRIRPLPKIR